MLMQKQNWERSDLVAWIRHNLIICKAMSVAFHATRSLRSPFRFCPSGGA